MPQLQPVAARNVDRSTWLKEKVTTELQKIFPIESDNYSIRLDKIYSDNNKFTLTQQKDAILSGRTLNNKYYGNLTIIDKKTKKIVEKIKEYKLADIPYLTNRSTMVIEGNDYGLVNQLRLKSGVYTRKRENDVVEAFFNLAKGKNFRMIMDPEKGLFYWEMDNAKMPLYPILKAFGVDDTVIQNSWGADLLRRNKEKSGNIEVVINKLYSKLFSSRSSDMGLNISEKSNKIIEYFNNTEMDDEVNSSTIGVKANRVTVSTILGASKKIINILKNNESTDDRDNLKHQTIHSIDDSISENIAKTAPQLIRTLKFKLDYLKKDKKPSDVLPKNMFGPTVKKFLTSTSIASALPQVNPVDVAATAYEVTHMGPGGIKDTRMIRPETRQVNSSHMGIIDPVATKENEKVGVTLFTTPHAMKDKKGKIFTSIRNVKTGKKDSISTSELENKVIAFPGQELKGEIDVAYKGKIQKMPASKVEYQFDDAGDLFSPQSGLIPFVNSISGLRALMATKHLSHALPLKHREQPLVQTAYPSAFGTGEKLMASYFLPKAKIDGTIKKITKDEIFIEGKNGETQVDRYETFFPSNQKTYGHTTPNVKKGDTVKKNQMLGESIYTKDGSLALGTNLRVSYLDYKGLNVNDGVVISENAAKKLTSLHMSKALYEPDESHIVSKQKFLTTYPNKFNIDQLKDVDNNGVVKKGSTLNEGDPIILAVEKTELTAQESLLGKLHKKLYNPYRDDSVTWDHPFEGKVTDVYVSSRRVMVLVQSEQPAQIGDKISQRSASKGVITAIIKDEEMLKDEQGRTIDVIASPTGIVSRQNPAQILEASVAKVAEQTGKPIIVDGFKIKDNHKFAKDLLKKHGLKDKETVFDPVKNRYIKNVMVGPQFILKQSNQVDTGFSARNFGKYDSNANPIKGGDEGAKKMGMLELNSLLSHNARENLKEISTIKGTKNIDFWKKYQMGLPLPTPQSSFSYNKLLGMMTASGIKINKENNKLIAAPLTDNDVKAMSKGEIKSPFMLRAKDLRPEKDGLFDPYVTGGPNGENWGHIKLAEPVINPLMKDPVKVLLNKTGKQLDEQIQRDGVASIRRELSKIDVDKQIQEVHKSIPNLRSNDLNRGVKQLKYLNALKKNKLKPADAYILNNVPVLPPVMRPVVKMAGSNDLQISSSNQLYSDLIHNNNAMKMVKKNLGDSDAAPLRKTLQQSVDALVGTAPSPNMKLNKQGMKGILTTVAGNIPKDGYFQKSVVSKTQDLSARGVINPDPTLRMDEVSLPEDMLWKTFEPFTVKRLVQKGYPILKAREMVKDRSTLARNEMILETKERPVIMNRAPQLQRAGTVGAYAIPTKNKVIGISPFLEKGLGADYDGDAMQVHVPVSRGAVDEAKKMTMSNNLFIERTKEGNLMAKPDIDTKYGLHKALNSTATGKTYKFDNFNQMKNAYKRGEIGLNDKVTLKGGN